MGTDIHSIAQVKRDGQWVTVAIGIAGDQRNYNTFAMLANVPQRAWLRRLLDQHGLSGYSRATRLTGGSGCCR